MENENIKEEHLSFTVWDRDIYMSRGIDYEYYDKKSNLIIMDLDNLQEILKDFARRISDDE